MASVLVQEAPVKAAGDMEAAYAELQAREEAKGAAAYLQAMQEAAEEGEPVDWDAVDGIVQAAVDTWYPRWL